MDADVHAHVRARHTLPPYLPVSFRHWSWGGVTDWRRGGEPNHDESGVEMGRGTEHFGELRWGLEATRVTKLNNALALNRYRNVQTKLCLMLIFEVL